MTSTTQAVLLGVLVLATAVWVGGYVAIGVVARVAARTLAPAQRVDFFRGLGRAYLPVGTPALVVALGTGAALASDHPHDGVFIAAAVVAGALVAALAWGVVQARRMTRLRAAALGAPEDAGLERRVRSGARAALLLRVAIGMLSLTLIALGSLLAT